MTAFLSVRDLRRPGLLEASFDVAKGDCVAIRGASGSGKTLLLRAIADLDPATGDVRLEGRSRESIPAPEWRRLVMIVPAESGWWDERVGSHFSDWSAARELVGRLGLPLEIGDWAVSRLSTGERQRLALARALVLHPSVLLLDEPTSALDRASALAVEALLEDERAAGRALLWVSHDAEQIDRVATRSLLVEAGRVREVSP